MICGAFVITSLVFLLAGLLTFLLLVTEMSLTFLLLVCLLHVHHRSLRLTYALANWGRSTYLKSQAVARISTCSASSSEVIVIQNMLGHVLWNSNLSPRVLQVTPPCRLWPMCISESMGNT